MAAFDFPGAPNPGDVFTDPTSGASFTWNGYAWMGGAANSLGALIVSDTPPAAPANNSLWFESDTGMLFLRYNDGNSSQWVQLNALPNGAGYMPLRGVSDGSDALPGQIGEVITASTATTTSVPMTTATYTNIVSISLTAGDWDVSGNVFFGPSAFNATALAVTLNTVSATVPTLPNLSFASQLSSAANLSASTIATATTRFSLAAPATVYLIGRAVFASGTCTGGGVIMARRAR